MNRRQMCVLVAVLSVLALGGQALAHAPNGRGSNQPSSDLPPVIPEGYLSPQDVHARYSGPALEVVLSMLEHTPFAGQPPRYEPDGEHHHFESEAKGDVNVNNMGDLPFNAIGPVDTVAYGRCPTCDTGTFDTEMLQMQLSGNSPYGPFLIRESPTLPSLGKTSITDIGGGMYHIDSFFDVFTELSVDGGATWMPSDGGIRVYLGGIPEPASFVLLALGLLGSAGIVRRRR